MTQREILEILDVYRREMFLSESIRGLMIKSKNKSYGRVFNTVSEMLKQGLLISVRHGKSIVCSLNFYNKSVIHYLSFLDFLDYDNSIKGEVKDSLIKIEEVIPIKNYVMLISSNSNQKTYDLVLIVDDEIDSSKILNIVVNYSRVNANNLRPYVFKVSEFKDMLLKRESNFVKDVFKNHSTYKGSESYYQIIKESVEHGFKQI